MIFIVENFIGALKKYAVFNGRARREEYWFFLLAELIVYILMLLLVFIIGASAKVFVAIFWLAVLLPAIGVSIRRLHDTNRSGWWLLISVVPFASLVLLYFMCQDSTPGNNRYGSNPKAGTVEPEQKNSVSPGISK